MSKHKVLVVDDDRKTVAMIRLYLEQEDYGFCLRMMGISCALDLGADD